MRAQAVLEMLGRPAFVVSGGKIVQANAAGWSWLGADDTLRAAIISARGTNDPRFEISLVTGSDDTVVALREDPTAKNLQRCIATWKLTPRQAQVLELVASGATNAAIGARLQISPRTVEVHIAALFERTGCESRAGLVAALLAGPR